MGMVGGGPGAFIGPIHCLAAEMDREIELVAGAFSSDAGRSRAAGETYRIDPSRAYPSLEAMIEAESARADGIEFVAIVTPNHLHLPAARAALAAGLHVMSDKPATATLAEARELKAAVDTSGLHYRLTYTYTGYPLVRHARELIAGGEIGAVRKLVVEYPQGWLAQPIEQEGSKQAGWRVDPAQAGLGGCIGDIGVHAFNLAEFVAGQPVTELLADLAAVVPGRRLDDDCSVLLRFANGARGVLLASQISVGELNGLRIRVYGERGGLDWRQEEPNSLTLHRLDGGTELVRTGTAAVGPLGTAATRTPGGHPEGYLEAFANLYRDFAALLRGEGEAALVPGIDLGLRSMAFVDTAVAASRDGSGWVSLTV
ncbi:gfo/Idh/MocA family oxidoreductase [Sphingomonas ginkgonis]|uniref:Gfo/Idh/MocA family oxidoreductase n=1 Tax=Sphingomonas ginkgonis TaxID=2315330 RepID=A0A429VE78_9SPHN|nr:Gfo/Idh/MocA family oxidoreductase [Sphingomonas ginkgonis]RST32171.1 gfo/Idh/MocA family oxidoreductase [Sphingomonas ginkgonis]